MAAQVGRSMLIKVGNGLSPETFTLVSGLRDTTITFSDQEIDVTSKDDNGIRRLLEGRVLRGMTMAGNGVFQDDAWANQMRVAHEAGTHLNYQMIIPGTGAAAGTYEGVFRITTLEMTGAHDGAVMYSLTLTSAGDITFTPAP